MCVAWKISSEFPEVTRVLVMKQTGNRYVAWISVEDDNVYEFIKKYNKEKRVPMSTAQAKRTMDADRKLVFHIVAANDAPKIEKWIGAEHSEWRRRCPERCIRHTAIYPKTASCGRGESKGEES